MAEVMCSRMFTCEECNFVFKKRSHLLRHQLVHSDERPYKCNICEKSFRSSFHLNRHVPTHSGIKSFRCEYEGCQVACITEWNLKRHIKRTHLGKFKCGKCDKEFRKNKLLQQHTSSEHKHNIISCEFPGCAQIFSVPAKMRQHLKIHTNKGYLCPVKDCSLKFSLWSECTLHAVQCKKRQVNCDVCGKMFSERSNLKAHKKIHSEEREVFQCTYDGCGRFYTKQYNLKVHVQSFHLNIRPFVCSKEGCNKRFHFQHLLRKHLENIHDKNVTTEKERKKKQTRRVNASTVSAITGYIPELWKKMTPEDMKLYADDEDSSVSGQEESNKTSNDNTTQAEMSPTAEFNDEVSSIITDSEAVHSSDVFDAITELVEIKPFMYKPILRPCRRRFKPSYPSSSTAVSSKVNTDINMEHEECMITNVTVSSNINPIVKVEDIKYMKASNVISKIKSACKMEHEECMKEFSDRFKNMLEEHHQSVVSSNNVNIHRLCHIQSLTESDSSDSDAQTKQIQCMV